MYLSHLTPLRRCVTGLIISKTHIQGLDSWQFQLGNIRAKTIVIYFIEKVDINMLIALSRRIFISYLVEEVWCSCPVWLH